MRAFCCQDLLHREIAVTYDVQTVEIDNINIKILSEKLTIAYASTTMRQRWSSSCIPSFQ